MKLFMSLLVLALGVSAQAAGQAFVGVQKPRQICGWIDNPTPANYWITDSDGLWVISAQGGYQAEGDVASQDDAKEYVNTNGHYGYYCGCVKATTSDTRKNGRRIVKISSSHVLPLTKCLNDANIQSTFRPKTLIHSSGKAYTECVQPEDELQIEFRGRQACVNEQNEYYFLAH